MRAPGEAWESRARGGLRRSARSGLCAGERTPRLRRRLQLHPVLDVDFGESGVIGDRALHSTGRDRATVGGADRGLREAGMATWASISRHGYVRADSHLAVPVDERSYAEIEPPICFRTGS